MGPSKSAYIVVWCPNYARFFINMKRELLLIKIFVFAVSTKTKNHPVVESVGLALPKFYPFGLHGISSPVGHGNIFSF